MERIGDSACDPHDGDDCGRDFRLIAPRIDELLRNVAAALERDELRATKLHPICGIQPCESSSVIRYVVHVGSPLERQQQAAVPADRI
jgi:hypothetical protein